MTLSTTETYSLRRWLQDYASLNPAYEDSIGKLLQSNCLLQQISQLNTQQQEHLAKLLGIRHRLSKNRNAQTSRENLEIQILGLLQIQPQSSVVMNIPEHADVATLLDTLNRISGLAQKYLGKVIVRNYWCGAKPISGWLSEFEVGESGTIGYRQTPLRINNAPRYLHPEQEHHLRLWLKEFIKQCNRVLPRFSQMLMDSHLILAEALLEDADSQRA